MLVTPIQPAAAVPAEGLFPTWRGREPYGERLKAASHALVDAHPALPEAIALLPFERFEAAWAGQGPVFRYNAVPPRASSLLDDVPEELRSPWLCGLLLWHIGRFGQIFPETRLADEFALHYTDAFQRIIDQVEAGPDFAALASDSFLKDLWLTRIVMIPAFAQVWWPHSGLSSRSVLRGGARAILHVFGRCGGHRPFLEGHTHDPVARAYWNEAGWGEALRLAALALPALPRARGVFGTAWFYDPAIREVTPRLAYVQDRQVGHGAFQLKIGSNEDAVRNATATSAERRNRYRDGLYLPTDYALIWSRRDLIRAYGA